LLDHVELFRSTTAMPVISRAKTAPQRTESGIPIDSIPYIQTGEGNGIAACGHCQRASISQCAPATQLPADIPPGDA
jgi:hypothetical protein